MIPRQSMHESSHHIFSQNGHPPSTRGSGNSPDKNHHSPGCILLLVKPGVLFGGGKRKHSGAKSVHGARHRAICTLCVQRLLNRTYQSICEKKNQRKNKSSETQVSYSGSGFNNDHLKKDKSEYVLPPAPPILRLCCPSFQGLRNKHDSLRMAG